MSVDATNLRPWISSDSVIDAKAVRLGTHRACSPEETLARIQPLLPRMGITRVADVTQLDDLGIPVYQAIRPNSRNLSVSQGKGVTRPLARDSALMESIETWHAEEPELPITRAMIGEMAGRLPYSLYDLNLLEQHVLHDGYELEWYPGHLLGSWEPTFVPAGYVRLDFTVSNAWLPPTFDLSSNGLASGNTLEEALLHSIYEVVERDTLARAARGNVTEMIIDPATIDGEASMLLLELLERAKADFELIGLLGPAGIPCFEARIISPNYPVVSPGYGCHLDRDVALSRAITEAAQSRLTMISGARDDIPKRAYMRVRERRTPVKFARERACADFRAMPTSQTALLSEDLKEVTRRLLPVVSCPPLVVNLTKAEFALPVVFVAAPQLRFWETHK